ncbi:hypothetical protein ILUMI_18288 [Ignelater luminosus]|uniref:Uncharacterized protein n=1 Tax=Ignelater luminosus TaxID=2038154 RepID=A0A8K0CIK0_IGNLU|nr:hypothetical protein ILUMI_18288 [Ignelater luminosus]
MVMFHLLHSVACVTLKAPPTFGTLVLKTSHRLDAKEDREYIISTYKRLLNKAHEYWEKRCEKLEGMTRNNEPIVIQTLDNKSKKQDVSVINLDSSNDESSRDNFMAAQNEIAGLKRLHQKKDELLKIE